MVLVAVAFTLSMVDVSVPALLVAVQGATGPLVVVPVSLAVLAAYRRRPHLCRAAAAVAACILADLVAGSLVASSYRVPASEASLRVVSANLLWENDDIERAAATLAALDPDVLVTIETLAAFEPVLAAALGPGMVLVARQQDTETPVVLWVKDELVPVAGAHYTDALLPSVQLPTPAGATVTVVGVHVESPERNNDVGRWRAQIHDLAQLAASAEGIVLAGDFNASLTHPPMRALLAHAGDAARATGHLWSPTWPTAPSGSVGHAPPVRVLDIDHVLVTRPVAVAGYERVALAGSDHDALAVDLAM